MGWPNCGHCHKHQSRGHPYNQASDERMHANKPVFVSKDFSVETGCNADGAVRRLDRTFVKNFGNN